MTRRRGPTTAVAGAAVLGVLAAAAPAGAVGACEAARHARAREDAASERRAPLVVGDSTMLLATPPGAIPTASW